MSATQFKFVKMFSDSYAVMVDGVRIGEIKKYVQQYNLIRSFTVRGWTARPDGRPTLPCGRSGPEVFTTRQQAAEAILAAIMVKQEENDA